jgi:hypothetical protein
LWWPILVGVLYVPFILTVQGLTIRFGSQGFGIDPWEFATCADGMYFQTLVCKLATATLALGLTWLGYRAFRRPLGLTPGRTRGWSLPVLVLASLALSILVSAIDPVNPSDAQQLSSSMTRPNMLATIGASLSTVLLAPLVEEVFSRGYLQRTMQARLPAWAAIGLATVFFAVGHHNLGKLPFLLVMGLWFGVVAWRSGSILPAVLCHIAVNTMAVFSHLVPLWRDGSILDSALPRGLLAALIFGACVVVLWRSDPAWRRLPDKPGEG